MTKAYDLEERTLKFAKEIIRLCKDLPKNSVNDVLINQSARAGTSIGANYREANSASGKKDFVYKVRLCRKEAKEIHYWLQVIVEANPDFQKRIDPLLQESLELIKIFSSIIEKSK